jgi:hypothetical protein
MACARAKAKTPAKPASFERSMEDRFTKTMPRGSRWDQEGAEFVSSDSQWCDRFSARLIALLADVDYGMATATALDLVSHHALRALSPEWVAEDLARAQVGLDRTPR